MTRLRQWLELYLLRLKHGYYGVMAVTVPHVMTIRQMYSYVDQACARCCASAIIMDVT